ncbi:hypothetical protein [Falsirhodobacter halotolerans]|uniref:hypothetical protein n=1 Tax=Falsirhodobacter halotolerans TaxID=1146892 RepID=UPI001FD02646|nr:hypothetical protein [Falsirhodobacter halotolerans]MCJ8139610.1 hypothetical protein [Falsirhodobacter halotolerans]
MRNKALTLLFCMAVPALAFADPTVPGGNGQTWPPLPFSAAPGAVATQPLDAVALDSSGLLTPRQTGFPRNLWGAGQAQIISRMITDAPANELPALHNLVMNLLLAEAMPPASSDADGTLFFARVDKLVALGALDQAQALLDVARAQGPEAFRRQFDIALLQGTETRACGVMNASPQLSPGYPARIYCLARAGEWSAAATTLHGAEAIGVIPQAQGALIARFLDPDLFEGEPSLPPPPRPTSLDWRMFEAIGEPLPTYTLPLAFAHAELRDTAGWKSQLDAAERLAQANVLDANHLMGFYTRQRPAASGGVWDRVAAVQRLDAAVQAGDVRAVAQALPLAWSQMQGAELEVPFARIFAEPLAGMALMGDAASTAFRLALLAGIYEDGPMPLSPRTAQDRFLAALAMGDPRTAHSVDGLSRAIAAGFAPDAVPDDTRELLDQGRRGEVILLAVDRISRGVAGDLRGVTEGIAALSALGMDMAARRVGVQLMILDRRG